MVFYLADISAKLLLSAVKKVNCVEHYRLRRTCKGLNELIDSENFKVFGSKIFLAIILKANVEEVAEILFGMTRITAGLTTIARDLHRIHFESIFMSANDEDDDQSENENHVVEDRRIRTILEALSPSCDRLDVQLGADCEEDIRLFSLITCPTMRILAIEGKLLQLLSKTISNLSINYLNSHSSPTFNEITNFRHFDQTTPEGSRDSLRSFLAEGIAAKSFKKLKECTLFYHGDDSFMHSLDLSSLCDIFLSGTYINGWFEGGRVYQLPINDQEYLLLRTEKVFDGVYSLNCFVCDNLEEFALKVIETFEPIEYTLTPSPRDFSCYYEALLTSSPSQYREITEAAVKVLEKTSWWNGFAMPRIMARRASD